MKFFIYGGKIIFDQHSDFSNMKFANSRIKQKSTLQTFILSFLSKVVAQLVQFGSLSLKVLSLAKAWDFCKKIEKFRVLMQNCFFSDFFTQITPLERFFSNLKNRKYIGVSWASCNTYDTRGKQFFKIKNILKLSIVSKKISFPIYVLKRNNTFGRLLSLFQT